MDLSNRPTLSIAHTFTQNLSYAASLAYVCGKRLDKVGRLDKSMNSKEKNTSNLLKRSDVFGHVVDMTEKTAQRAGWNHVDCGFAELA